MSWWEFWKPSQERKDFVQEFLRTQSLGIPGVRPIDQLEFTVLDTETSGLDPGKDSILSFGGVKISKMSIQISTAVEWYPKSERSGSKTAAIHGLVGIADAISVEDFLRKLLPYLGNSIIVGHHIGFDLEMILRQLRSFGLAELPNPVIDTMHLAVRLEHGPQADWNRISREAYSLDQLCTRYGIETEDRHTAAGDAFLTAQLLLKLLRSADKKGIRTFRDLIR